LRRCAAEFVGTFLLVFAGPGAVIIDEVSGGGVGSLGISLSFGLAVMAAIYAVGHLSGTHIVAARAQVDRRRWSSSPSSEVRLEVPGGVVAGVLLRKRIAVLGGRRREPPEELLGLSPVRPLRVLRGRLLLQSRLVASGHLPDLSRLEILVHKAPPPLSEAPRSKWSE